MNSLKNKVNLIGNLGFNPEIKMLDGGKKLAKVTMIQAYAGRRRSERTLWTCRSEIQPHSSPANAKELMRMRSYQKGVPARALRCTKSVMM